MPFVVKGDVQVPSKCRLAPAGGEPVCGGDQCQMLPEGGGTGAGMPHRVSCFPAAAWSRASPCGGRRWVPAAGLRGDSRPLSRWAAGLLCHLFKTPCAVQSPRLWSWPVGLQQHVLFRSGPKWAWLRAPAPSPV